MRRNTIMALVAPTLLLFSACVADTSTEDAGATSTQEAGEVFWSHRFSVREDLAYGEDPAQKLDLYLQGSWVGEPDYFERAPETRPTLIFIHGGGWVGGDKTGNDPFFIHFLERGWHVVNITYRLGPGTAPAAVDDVICALDWVVKAASEYGFDRERIVVSGASAGGHLALMTGILGSRPGHDCYPWNDFRVGAVINWFGITDIEAVEQYLAEARPDGNYALSWIGEKTRVAEISSAYSPLKIVDGGAPPILTIHGDADSVVPHNQATSFHARLDALGVRNELQSMTGGKHLGFSDAQFQQAFGAIFSFLEQTGM